ncbi:MAG: hypothetical protein A2096_01440 [Spirochaetes bacterium GWF1_41_5]|nr:MAG: hypothetical protein A2096_01440 [Spirochaetes bacterium GWF1_41_5]
MKKHYILSAAGFFFLNILISAPPSVVIKKKNFNYNLEQENITQVSCPVLYLNGILFTCTAQEKSRVFLGGSFDSWKTFYPLLPNKFGIYSCFLSIELPAGRQSYRFRINDVWFNDPSQELFVDDGYGTRMTAFDLSKPLNLYTVSPKPSANGAYCFFLPDAGYKKVSIISSENSWNPYTEPMTRNEDGYWIIIKDITTHLMYYKFFADGKEIMDSANQEMGYLDDGRDVSIFKISGSNISR